MSGDVQATLPASRPSVFLSYASEDRAAARALRNTLAAAGLEVWLDEDELGGGEPWDTKLRNQIRTCTYFMPLISATTEVRREGYFRREWRLVALILFAGLLLRAAAAPPLPIVTLPVPSAPGAMGSSLALGPDGAAYLSWLEPTGGENWAMKFSRFDAAHLTWGETRAIAQGADFFVNWADFPVLAVQADRLTAVWFVNNPAHHAAPGHHGAGYRAVYRSSLDQGQTWSPELPISDEFLPVEFVALQPLRDGRLLAAWLDGRAHNTGSDRQALYARVLGAPGPDMLVDDLVCDCCQLSFVPTTDGGALLAYRGRTKDEVRDMQLARYDGKSWSAPTTLNPDGWKIAGCPVNGPKLAECGDLIGAVWFTAADNQARVLARVSDNAGDSFSPVVRVDLGRPQGRVDSVMLPDGTLVMTWLEMSAQDHASPGGIYLRTLSLEGKLSKPQMVAPSSTARMSGFPRMVLLGGRQLLLTDTVDSEPSRLRALLLDLK